MLVVLRGLSHFMDATGLAVTVTQKADSKEYETPPDKPMDPSQFSQVSTA